MGVCFLFSIRLTYPLLPAHMRICNRPRRSSIDALVTGAAESYARARCPKPQLFTACAKTLGSLARHDTANTRPGCATSFLERIYVSTQPGAMTPHANDEMTQHITTTSFEPDWNATDISNLQPGYLPRTKPVRAWERKPASPFTKQRLRVGKVWKRPTTLARAATGDAADPTEERSMKRSRPGQGSPVKIVKRLCLGAHAGVGSQFDRIASPTKRIVTRSALADDLVALEEEDDDVDPASEEEDVEGTVIEYLDEDGNQLQPEANEVEDGEGWSDVEGPESGLVDATNETSTPAVELAGDEDLTSPSSVNVHDRADVSGIDSATASKPEVAQELANESALSGAALAPSMEPHSLPAGFVSPVRRKRSVSRRLSSMPAETGRRRTLPRTFAPAVSTEEDNLVPTTVEQKDYEDHSDETVAMDETFADNQMDDLENGGNAGVGTGSSMDDDSWEDVAEETETGDHNYQAPQDLDAIMTVNTGDHSASISRTTEESFSPITKDSSRIDLPLRKSPRRKSTSPLKARSFQSYTAATPHLVAFSPVKETPLHQDGTSTTNTIVRNEVLQNLIDEPPVMLERSVSAPPEEPSISPRRSAKPRVSDDTALLQAFLNRAAEQKSSRRLSATKRESLSNRRDSDTVRQALASPAKPDVLGTLDPNSPLPKKPLSFTDDAESPEKAELSTGSPTQSSVDNENNSGRTTRRSHRDRRRVERSAPLAHTRISLRGNTEPVVLKRSEAQELATITRSNTRKNKGGSIMPTVRLKKLNAETPPIEASPEDGSANNKAAKAGARNVQWAETLTTFQDAPSQPEVQLFELGDSNTAPKLQSMSELPAADNDDEEAVPAPPPAAETPSKPKVRRLRAPRTASTPAKPATPDVSEKPAQSAPVALKQKQPRRSRLATSAKGPDAPSLLPADVVSAQESESKPKAVPRKKAASRLPGPAPPSTSHQDNQSLISSPPKKKPANTLPPTKNFAPKLDFQTRLSAPSKATDNPPEGVSGLQSPAKRGGRGLVFGNPPPGPVFGSKTDESEERKVPGINSPAKKRTRRAI